MAPFPVACKEGRGIVELMSDQVTAFVHVRLRSNLLERSTAALRYINTLSGEDVLRCDGGCAVELFRRFAVMPPALALDRMVADNRIGELVDSSLDRKTGQTGHAFFIPIEGEVEWLEEVDSQRTAVDNYPLAFLDRVRNRVSIKITISPEDAEGELKRKLSHRAEQVEMYAQSVALEVSEFNKNLVKMMIDELNKRKNSILRAERELEAVGLPRVHNPEHEENAIQMERLLRSLGKYMSGSSVVGDGKKREEKEVKSFIVHGHDEKSLFELKDYLQNTLKLNEPVILRKLPGLGKTLIEKFETAAEVVELVFVLLTPDEKVAEVDETDAQKRRARQNVILELGFFLGKLGRSSGRVLLLHKGPIEIPSDICGIEYIDITGGVEGAGETIRRELRALGILG